MAKEIPAKIAYEDDLVLAFYDINPAAPVHILIIPKQHYANLNDAGPGDAQLLGHIQLVAAKLAKELNIAESGYRVITNCNQDGGQVVFHLHYHLLGGAKLKTGLG